MGVSCAAKGIPHPSSAGPGHAMAGGTNIGIVDWQPYMGVRMARDPQHLEEYMTSPWGSLGEPMVGSKCKILLGALTLFGINQSEKIPAGGS